MRKLYTAKNLVSHDIVEACPWDFSPDDNQVKNMTGLSKALRRTSLLNSKFEWQTYSGFAGVIASQRVSEKNPPASCRALVIDYDAASSRESVEDFISHLPAEVQPNWIESTLGGKWRGVWIFEKDILMNDLTFSMAFLKKLIETLGADKMLPGYDEASCKATQMWTTGLLWLENHDRPLSFNFLCGIVYKLIEERKSDGFEIPIAKIGEEVERRFPGRWQGDFLEGSHGVRFWDEKADNPRGAFITRHGCRCFTGLKAFVSWEEIFGRVWVETNRAANFGEITKEIYFDGSNYWGLNGSSKFVKNSREDTLLSFRAVGLSGRVNKGQTLSDAEKALKHVQINSRVKAALPILYRPPGLLRLNGELLLNVSYTQIIQPAKESADPGRCPLAWRLMTEIHARPELKPEEYLLSWTSRTVLGILNQRPVAGQALFLCGPKNNGKTLLCTRVLAPLFGNKMADPYDYFMGITSFNSDLMEAGLLAINDEQAPYSDKDRDRFLQRLKAFVANSRHMCHFKFRDKSELEWFGRLVITLNDDAKSVGMLPDLNSNTADKMMFFATKPYSQLWPDRYEIEAQLERELPHLMKILVEYKTPRTIDIGGRFGVESYFDPVLVETSRQQDSSYNLLEIIKTWQTEGSYWLAEPERFIWEGSPTDLLTQLSEHQSLNAALRDWSVQRVAKSLTSLARLKGLHITAVDHAKDRIFKIERFVALKEVAA